MWQILNVQKRDEIQLKMSVSEIETRRHEIEQQKNICECGAVHEKKKKK